MVVVGYHAHVAAINNRNQAVGWRNDLEYPYAILWDDTVEVTLLGEKALAINDSSDVLAAGDARSHATLEKGDGSVIFLEETIPGLDKYAPNSGLSDINDSRQFIGTRDIAGEIRPFLWEAGTVYGVEADEPGWEITTVQKINDHGQILGTAEQASSGRSGPVLLTPTPGNS
ncbi:MAG TPA: hypothetical protein VFL93_09345 [Longimicrobiaceae bacterium]|nr:hypothetical protein [Longimicrobiaceae bacterium]